VRGWIARFRSLAHANELLRSSQADPERPNRGAAHLHASGDRAAVPTAVDGSDDRVARREELTPSRDAQDDPRRGRQRDRDAPRQLLCHVAAVGEAQLEPPNPADAAGAQPPEHDTPPDEAGRPHRDPHGEAQPNADANAVERKGREHNGRVMIARLCAPREAHAHVDDPRSAGRHRQLPGLDVQPGGRVAAGRGSADEPRASAKIDRETRSPHKNDQA
jgi:hypothetical protein